MDKITLKNIKYIDAGAGSGKTYKLTHLLSDLLKDGKVNPSQVIATTYTLHGQQLPKSRTVPARY